MSEIHRTQPTTPGPDLPIVNTATDKAAGSGSPALGAILAAVSALVSLAILQLSFPLFVVSSDYDIGMGASNEARMALLDQTTLVNRKNTTVILALGGALLGASLAMVAHGCCALPMRLLAGAGWGGVWGMVVGYAAARANVIIVPQDALPSLTNVGLAHALTFGLLGAGLGLMHGGFSRNSQAMISSAIGGLLAGAGGGFLFAILVGFVAPGQDVANLIPSGAIAQLLWLALPFVIIAMVVARPPNAGEPK